MNSILPIDIANLIYNERALVVLRDICKNYSIDFNKFCHFLVDNNAVLTGSAALHCIDNECEFNDLDIFVFSNNGDTREYYKKFLHVFTVDQSLVDIDKEP